MSRADIINITWTLDENINVAQATVLYLITYTLVIYSSGVKCKFGKVSHVV